MADIELKKRDDPKAAVALLKNLQTAHVPLGTLTLAKAEKFFRELSSLPLSVFTTCKADFEMMKKLAKDICRAWADQRRQQILYDEIMAGVPFRKQGTSSSSIGDRFEKQARIATSSSDEGNLFFSFFFYSGHRDT